MLVHYCKGAYGISLGPKEVEPDEIYSNTSKYEEVSGNVKSDYAVLLFDCNISNTNYVKCIFTNDLDTCDSEIRVWLDPYKHDKCEQAMMERHYFGVVLDLKNEKEIGYGDAWQMQSSDERAIEDCWHKYTGLDLD